MLLRQIYKSANFDTNVNYPAPKVIIARKVASVGRIGVTRCWTGGGAGDGAGRQIVAAAQLALLQVPVAGHLDREV